MCTSMDNIIKKNGAIQKTLADIILFSCRSNIFKYNNSQVYSGVVKTINLKTIQACVSAAVVNSTALNKFEKKYYVQKYSKKKRQFNLFIGATKKKHKYFSYNDKNVYLTYICRNS